MQYDDMDKTVFEGPGGSVATGEGPRASFSVSPEGQQLRPVTYVAQQSSLEDYTPGLNPLVNCAAHLLLEMVQLRTPGAEKQVLQGDDSGGEQAMDNLRRRLEAEIRGFENRAMACEIDQSHVLAARYVLCTALDESVSTSSLGTEGGWSRQALLNTFHSEAWGGEKFFQIIERCMQQPARNLYLLELLYLLLSLGFEGRYKLQARGFIELELLRERIYRQVRILRGEPGQDLAKKMPDGKYKHKIYTYVPVSLLIFFVLSCLCITYFGFSNILTHRTEPILKQLATCCEPFEEGGK